MISAEKAVEALEEIVRYGTIHRELSLHVSPAAHVMLRMTQERHPPTGPLRMSINVHVTRDILGPYAPHLEIRGLYEQQVAQQIAEHYRVGGIAGVPGEHHIVPGVDVQHPGWIDLREHAVEIGRIATSMIGAAGVTVEARRVWHDGWVVVVR